MRTAALMILSILSLTSVVGFPAAGFAETMVMRIQPDDNLVIGGNRIRRGVMVGEALDIVWLAQNRRMSHYSCEVLLGGTPSYSSIIEPLSPWSGPAPPKGTILLEVDDILIDLKPKGAVLAMRVRWTAIPLATPPTSGQAVPEPMPMTPIPQPSPMPPSSVPPSPPSPPSLVLESADAGGERDPSMTLAGATCVPDEICLAAGGDMKGIVECDGLKFGISTNKSIDLGAGPISVTIKLPGR